MILCVQVNFAVEDRLEIKLFDGLRVTDDFTFYTSFQGSRADNN